MAPDELGHAIFMHGAGTSGAGPLHLLEGDWGLEHWVQEIRVYKTSFWGIPARAETMCEGIRVPRVRSSSRKHLPSSTALGSCHSHLWAAVRNTRWP